MHQATSRKRFFVISRERRAFQIDPWKRSRVMAKRITQGDFYTATPPHVQQV